MFLATAWPRWSWQSGEVNSALRGLRPQSRKQSRSRNRAWRLTRWYSRVRDPALALLMSNLQMLLAEVSDGAFSPDLHEVIIQPCSDYGADDWNQPRGPLLHDLCTGTRCYSLNNARHEL